MRKKYVWVVVIAIAAGFAFKKPAENYFDIAKSLDIYATLFKEVNAYYVDEIEPRKLVQESINGMLNTLDPYTTYIPEDQVESFRISTTGQYGGVGAIIGIVNGKRVIIQPYKNFPAERGGVKVGDEIISIDGKDVRGKSTSDISSLLKGQPKTEVSMKLQRPGVKEPLSVTLRREKINIPNVSFFGMLDGGIGYILLEDFTPGAGREVAVAMNALKAKGANKLILDLRGNPGGLLMEAVNVVSLFIPKGKEVVSTKGKVEEWNKSYKTLNQPLDLHIPLVVLVDEESASASEIVAGALQDYDRAVLIGQKTFGKGLVQTTRPLAYHSQLKITTAKYHIPSGRCIQALDYTHRKEDGTAGSIPDSLKHEFKTANGRRVMEGGGLDPDIAIPATYSGAVTNALVEQGLIFEFAAAYCNQHAATANVAAFKLTEEDYQSFVSYIKKSQFSYTTPLEKEVDELIGVSRQEKHDAELQNQLKMLKQKVASEKEEDLLRFKKEIMQLLESQIAFNYNLQEGRARYYLGIDPEVLEAKKLLLAPAEWQKILLASK